MSGACYFCTISLKEQRQLFLVDHIYDLRFNHWVRYEIEGVQGRC